MDTRNVPRRFDRPGVGGEPHGKEPEVRDGVTVHAGKVAAGGVAAESPGVQFKLRDSITENNKEVYIIKGKN